MAKVPSDFSQWKWPWTEGEVDEEKAAKLIWNARRNEEAAEDKVKERDERIATLTTDLDAAKAAKSGTDEEAQAELKDLRKENRELKEAEAKSLPADEKKIWQLTAAVEFGLTEKQAARLQGDDLDAIKADAKEFARDLGIELDEGDDGEDEGDGDEGSRPPISQPKPNFKTGARSTDPVAVPSNTDAAAKALPSLWS